MRDINRIDTFCAEIAKLWKENFPDWRFGQFIFNFLSWYGKDPFFLEEDKLLEQIKLFIANMKGE